MNKKLTKTLLGDVCQLHRGYDLPNQNRIDGPYPVISSSGISGMHHDYKCDGENVITGRYGTIGEVYYYNGKCWPLNTALFVSNFFDNYPKYIYYFLKCTLKVDGKDKSTVPGVDRNVLHALKVSYFSDKDYQIEIASVLSCIDAKIDLNAQLCAELEAMAKTLYDYWFVQFDFPDENGKPYRTSGGAMEWCQKLGREVPKGWKAKRVSELTKVITGKEDANFSTADGEYKFFTCGQETLCCDTPAFTGKAVLIAGNGDFNVKHYTGSFNAYQRTYVLIPNEDKYYAAMFIAAKDTIQSFRQGSNGSIVKFITKGDVENITLLSPTNDDLLQRLNGIIEQIELFEKENDELIKLRDWLLPMLMNGQAYVKVGGDESV